MTQEELDVLAEKVAQGIATPIEESVFLEYVEKGMDELNALLDEIPDEPQHHES